MDNLWLWVILGVVILLTVALVAGFTLSRKRKISLREQGRADEGGAPSGQGYSAGGGIALAPGGTEQRQSGTPPDHPVEERPETDGEPGVGDDAAVPRESPRRGIVDVTLPSEQTAPADTEEVPEQSTAAAPERPADTEAPARPAEPESAPQAAPEPQAEPLEEIEPPAGRLGRLRGKLSKSRSAFGQSLVGLLGAGDLDEDSWEEVEDTLLVADLGAATTTEIVTQLREELHARGVRSSEQARTVLREVLVNALHPELERSVRALPHDVDGSKRPAVVLVAGVNGTGKTTTTGKLARVLVGQDHKVVLGAADTFRAAAADQLQTWSERVGAEVVRGNEGADPASVAFDAVKRGIDAGADAVLVDTAGRLHTKTGLMDELGKVKRVVEKQARVDEVLLVLDATTGQNGLAQARVFGEVVNVTGIVLTKLDGTAKGGIVFQVQRELGVPVKLVGLGEGPDDLAPFEPEAFVDALLE
ncbi:signal recognition particle-docking protein FtsY [Haloechinothrix halophila]|uniref:signal recognition particle-docking protein FtsY n=1 Tax=Haloechinothrix halophila TaxID=1069073 RepID=UPI0018C8B1B7|nr:signal recognition particle-docking protein FtsY [Haloechinothrix halophila]